MATVVISLDAELAWGFVDFPAIPAHRLENAREMWHHLLSLFDRYEVPATWAVVGHLFLEECDGNHGDHPMRSEWFEKDPGRSEVDDGRWYGPSLLEAVSTAPVDHEIACHSFSHVDFRDESIDSEVAAAELRRCHDLASDWGFDLESFVYPRNRIAHRDVLAAEGFSCYRDLQPKQWYDGTGMDTLQKAIGGSRFGPTPPAVRPTRDEYGLVSIPASLFLFCFEGRARAISDALWTDPVVRMAQRGVDNAIRNDAIVHFWLHPNNLTDETDIERLDRILSYIDRRRRETDLSVQTMCDIAASYAP